MGALHYCGVGGTAREEKSLPPGGLGWGGPAANGDPTAFLCIFDTLIFSIGLGHTSDLSENSEPY